MKLYVPLFGSTDIPKSLAAMEAQVMQPDIVGLGATTAVFSAMDMETVQMHVTPGKYKL